MQDRSSLKIILYISVFLNVVLVATIFYFYNYNINELTPLTEIVEEPPRTLQKYSYENLSKTTFEPQEIEFGEVVDEVTTPVVEDPTDTEKLPYYSRMFYYEVEGRTMSGLAHLPAEEGTYPVLIMLRGYVDPGIYEPGVGTSPSARYFAQHGYITLAPDHFGYGESDQPPPEPFADRLISYVTVLQLIANVDQLNNSLDTAAIAATADENKIGIWGHSNGGQIALSTLASSGKAYPTVLWAPVSKPFPYSVLYFTDEFEDNGRYLRKLISQFEALYDIESFSMTNYFDRIKAPVQLHQGALDDAVPLQWSNELYQALQNNEVSVEYFVYEEADHNMRPDWDITVERSLAFFDRYLKL